MNSRLQFPWVVVVLMAVACGSRRGASAPLNWQEDFSAPASGWQVESDASAAVTQQDGVMHILIEAPNRLAWASAGREFADYHLGVLATQVAGPDDNEYGILARMADASHFYRFSISGNGYYLVSKHNGEEWSRLSDDWTVSDAIRLGTASNLIEVICQGEKMIFLVNGVELVEVEDADFLQGDIGLYAGSFYETGVEVQFDDLFVRQP